MNRQPSTLLVLAPLWIEAFAARSSEVMRTGMGPERARQAAAVAAVRPARAVAVLGFCGALDPELEPGDVVVATELQADGNHLQHRVASAPDVAAALDRAGIPARQGPIVSVRKLTRGAERARLADTGAIAVDMESAWLAAAANGRAFAVLRAVVDTPSRELVRISTLAGGVKAYRALRRAAGALETWTQTLPDDKET